MIGKLRGVVVETGTDHVIIDVHGVGYVVYMATRALATMPEEGQAITLFIETQVREDAIRLFGFFSRLEQEWFRLLQSVQGVGARVALAVLGTLAADALASAIALRDITLVARAPGVGKKVAERIVTELKNKAPLYAAGVAAVSGAGQNSGGVPVVSVQVADAVSALCNLGYSREVAASAVAAAVKGAGEGSDSAMLIRFGLKELSR